MRFFADTVIKPLIIENGYKEICEIGASFGRNTEALLESLNGSITIIDPCLDEDLEHKFQHEPGVKVYRGTSLEVLAQLTDPFDCILIDGDHNWYTVYSELKTIEERQLLRVGGTIFFHDVAWPYGRRDMYFQPELIPAEFIREHARLGIQRNQSELSCQEIFNAEFHNATTEGGERNGVLTAIEDFVRDSHDRYKLFCIMEESGLGVLYRKNEASSFAFTRLRLRAFYLNALASLKQNVWERLPGVSSSTLQNKEPS